MLTREEYLALWSNTATTPVRTREDAIQFAENCVQLWASWIEQVPAFPPEIQAQLQVQQLSDCLARFRELVALLRGAK